MRGDGITDSKSSADWRGEAGPPPRFPLLVRVLAVAYVLSRVLQLIGFLLLTGPGAFLFVMRRGSNGWAQGLVLGGVAWVIACAAFRWWFRRWGRKHYPQVNKESDGDD